MPPWRCVYWTSKSKSNLPMRLHLQKGTERKHRARPKQKKPTAHHRYFQNSTAKNGLHQRPFQGQESQRPTHDDQQCMPRSSHRRQQNRWYLHQRKPDARTKQPLLHSKTTQKNHRKARPSLSLRLDEKWHPLREEIRCRQSTTNSARQRS